MHGGVKKPHGHHELRGIDAMHFGDHEMDVAHIEGFVQDERRNRDGGIVSGQSIEGIGRVTGWAGQARLDLEVA